LLTGTFAKGRGSLLLVEKSIPHKPAYNHPALHRKTAQ